MQHSKRNSDCTIIIAIGHCPFCVVLIVLQLVEPVSVHQNILLWYSPNSEPQRHACRASRTATTWCVKVYYARLTCSRIILESFQTWKREGETTQLNHCHERTSAKPKQSCNQNWEFLTWLWESHAFPWHTILLLVIGSFWTWFPPQLVAVWSSVLTVIGWECVKDMLRLKYVEHFLWSHAFHYYEVTAFFRPLSFRSTYVPHTL